MVHALSRSRAREHTHIQAIRRAPKFRAPTHARTHARTQTSTYLRKQAHTHLACTCAHTHREFARTHLLRASRNAPSPLRVRPPSRAKARFLRADARAARHAPAHGHPLPRSLHVRVPLPSEQPAAAQARFWRGGACASALARACTCHAPAADAARYRRALARSPSQTIAIASVRSSRPVTTSRPPRGNVPAVDAARAATEQPSPSHCLPRSRPWRPTCVTEPKLWIK